MIPPLRNGDHLSQPEFHRRYEATPPGFKAELIGGIVFVASPLHRPHSSGHQGMSTLLGVYQARTPGVRSENNVTTILGPETEPQPDNCLYIRHEYGGRVNAGRTGPVKGPPDLVAEVADTTAGIDLFRKKADYRAAGVREYLVLCVGEGEPQGGRLYAFDLSADREIPLGRSGVFKSSAFPGLWVDGKALLAEDLARALRTLERGLATQQHAAFVRKLKAAKRKARKENPS
jgi:Uma2 family endonuclease